MAVGRISGPLLKSNLIRNGIDLAFETDLLYLDVNNQRVGIRNSNPQYELDITGTTRTTDIVITNDVQVADITISGNTISSSLNELNLGTLDNVVYQQKAIVDSLKFEGNTISTLDSNANIELRANGTGSVEVKSNLNVAGNIHATGNITADGDIVLGDQTTDTITINARVSSDLVPTLDNTYKLGSDPSMGGNRWADVWVNNFYANAVLTSSVTVDGVDLTLKQGNIYYVAENGNDTFDGDHPQNPYATIQKALSVATSGDTVHIYPGEYTEVFPLTVPVGVTVKGHSLRSVSVIPTTETRYNDAFLLNGETTVEDLTVKDFFSGGNYFTITSIVDSDTFQVNVGTAPYAHTYVSGGTVDFSDSTPAINITACTYDHTTGILEITTASAHDSYVGHSVFISNLTFSCNSDTRVFPDNGYAFRFATDFEVTSRSPYIRNVTVITTGSTTTAEDPRGFNAGDAGKGAYVDGAYATASSKEASMLFHSATFITPGVDALTCTNGVRVEWLNSFTYFANRSIYAYDSNSGFANDGKTRIRLSGISGTFQVGDLVTFSSTDLSTVVSVTVESIEDSDVLVVDGKNTDLLTFDTTPQSIVGAPSTASATTIEYVDVMDFGAEIRLIASASVYGNYGLYGDGPGVLMYAIGQNLAYIGNGKEVTNDPITVIQANEVTELNSAKIRYTSVDHQGDFRVGDLFHVDQQSGTVAFSATALNIDLTSGVTFTDGANTTFINGSRIDTGNLRFSGNTIETTSGNLNLDSATNEIWLVDDVEMQQNLDVLGDFTVSGNITLGEDSNVNINVVARIASNLIPAATNTYDLGASDRAWRNVYVNKIDIDDIEINTNYITTTVSNSDLELRASGTGRIYIPNNDVQIDNNLTVSGTTSLSNTNVSGNFNITGNINQTGNITVSENTLIQQKLFVNSAAQFEEILIDGNYITTTSSNANLELKASGSGTVLIPFNDATVENNVNVVGTISATNLITSNVIVGNQFVTDNILIKDNYITTTDSSSDLELRAAGTGGILLEDITVNSTTISSTTSITFDPGSENLEIDGTGGLILPTGTTGERNSGAGAGQIRYNTSLSRFEGYDGVNWFNLVGVEDLDGDTKITAELTPGANDNIIRFIISGSTVATLTSNLFAVPEIQVDDININGNVISTTTADTDLQFSANGTGQVKIENFGFSNSTITNTVSDAVSLFENSGTGYWKFTGTYGVVIPVGDTSSRSVIATGMIRYNTDDERVELYDGVAWTSVAGSAGGLNLAEAEDLSIETALICG